LKVHAWQMTAVGDPLVRATREESPPGPGEVVVEVEGCGICHTDLGFLDDGVPTRKKLPLTLGHEISGRVVDCGEGAEDWADAAVVVPAVIPCGHCELCRSGSASICRGQVFPGNDIDGGFASHVRVPAHGLCRVDEARAGDVALVDLAVLADAVTTPYQSIRRSGLTRGDLAIFVGVGGVGGFGVQIAAALGATVVALDVDPERLEQISAHGASLALNPREQDTKSIRRALREFAAERGAPAARWKIFETSGTAPGQELAFALLNFGAYLGVVGFTQEKVQVRLSNLMAFDARAEGNWGCVPELYPEVLELVLAGKVAVRPFVERHPMSEINAVLDRVRRHEIKRRPVLVPDFD
jgi:6-hydroxycyclohex-1-ene-1-carbonyl-CoA dehydrogenase